ncbi:MAG: hypothetical protein O7B25_05390 [Gammaproteobacteria bacterium]|nr:hypothetical protein [Gammaproteobacteria bacterium]
MASMSLFEDMPEFIGMSDSAETHKPTTPARRKIPSQLAAPRDIVRTAAADRHLLAAGRLANAIRRLPEHSVEETRAGLAICRHLIALLEENEQDPSPNDR